MSLHLLLHLNLNPLEKLELFGASAAGFFYRKCKFKFKSPALHLPFLCVLCVLCGYPLLVRAQDAPQSPMLLRSAEEALSSHLPEVAIEKLHLVLTSTDAFDDALRERAEADLTSAMLDSGDPAGALARLEYPATDIERFWKAEALSALRRWDDAEPIYEQLATDGPPPFREPALIGQAESLHALGRTADAQSTLAAAHSPSNLVLLRLAELYLESRRLQPARQILSRVTPSSLLETRWRQFVEGRLYLAEDQATPALQDFEELLKDPRGLTPALDAAATVGLTDARIVLNGREVADNVLEKYIWDHPDSPFLEDMFRRLDAIYAAEEDPSESELQQWAAKDPPRRAALALYYLATSLQRQRRQEKAIHAYTEFVQRYPRHAFTFEAWMQLGELYLDTSRIPTAIASFEGAMRATSDPVDRARAEIATGNAYFAQGEFLLAAETFRAAAPRSSQHWLEAVYDSAVAWLHLGNYDQFLQDYTLLPETDQRRVDLLLEEGLLQARSGDPHAAVTLRSFIRNFPDNRRVTEARLALAELSFASGDIDSASNLIKAAYVSQPADTSREQADYFAIFIADSAPDRQDDNVLRLGLQFLKTWPASPLLPQVRMKLGQVYFRREDYANAQTQFETLAQQNPADPLTENALILAGQCSVRGMSPGGADHGLALFDRVAKGSGPLRLYARQEEALLKAQMGLNKDAVIIYDDILRSNPDTHLRLASICGKADCLIAAENEIPASSPAPSSPAPSPIPNPSAIRTPQSAMSCTAAIALFDQIIADPDVTIPWRDQALYKKGRCLAKQGLADQALAAFYDILNAPAIKGRPPQPDFFWFEKAGYDAAAMLESKSQWPGAISILEKLAQAGGPRSTEARKRADILRLDHFIWN